MRKGLKVSRGVQLLGAAALVMGVVSCSQRTEGRSMALYFLAGLIFIVGARVYEWMTKE